MRNLVVLLFIVLIACSDEDTVPEVTEKNFDIIRADLLSGDHGAIIKIDPDSGTQTIISENGRFQRGPVDVVIDETGAIFTTVSDVPGSPPEIVKVDIVSGTQTTVSSGGFLKATIKGIAVENDENLLVTKGYIQFDVIPKLLRINKITGEQEVVSEGGQFRNVYDVIVSKNKDIYVLGTGIKKIGNINYEVPTLFEIDSETGAQSILSQIEDLDLNFYDIALDIEGNIIAIGNAIILIHPESGIYETLIPKTQNDSYGAIAITDGGEIFVSRHYCCPSSNFSICRVDVENGSVEPFSLGHHLESPSGMTINYLK